MKLKFIFALLISLAATQAIFIKSTFAKEEAKKQISRVEEKDAEDIKTFDFERIFADAEKYYQAAIKWQKLKCTPQSGFVCTKRECPKLKIAQDSHIILDKKSKTISLCKNKFCRYYPAEFEQTGVFFNAKVKESDGILIRILGDSRFKEVSMIGLDAYITNGNCENISDEKENEKNK